MLIDYIVGALTMLTGVSFGFVFGKPYLDRWQQKRLAQSQPAKPQAPKQPPNTGGLTNI